MVRKYGKPDVLHFSYPYTPEEFEFLLSTMEEGRAHDVTVFILKWVAPRPANSGKNLSTVVIRKPVYPKGLYRVPGGAIKPGEDFEKGVKREMEEETGLTVELQRYILRVCVQFLCHEKKVKWVTHVFTGRRISGHLHPKDREEVVEARWLSLKSLLDLGNRLRTAGPAGMKYRADLQEAAIQRILSHSVENTAAH